MKKITISAPAKVNLFLEITGKHKDGYHELATIFAKLELADTIRVQVSKCDGPVKLKIKSEAGQHLSAGPDNLIIKAAEAFRAAFGIKNAVSIALEKRIPIGAGLGGGSSDAAATLKALNRVFAIAAAPHKHKRLMAIAKKLGADVPVFMRGETFLIGRGIGDRLTPIKVKGRLPALVLAYPGVPVSTAWVYKNLRLPAKAGVLTSLSSLHKLKIALEKGYQLSKWGNLLFNRLERVVLEEVVPVHLLRNELAASGADAVLMSGSGSCVFALVKNQVAAEHLAEKVVTGDGKVFVTRFARGEVCRLRKFAFT